MALLLLRVGAGLGGPGVGLQPVHRTRASGFWLWAHTQVSERRWLRVASFDISVFLSHLGDFWHLFSLEKTPAPPLNNWMRE